MHASYPYLTMCTAREGSVLEVLARTTRPLTGRDVARLSRTGARPSLMRALRRLVDEGVVLAEPAGNALLFTLNRDHLVAPLIDQLMNLRQLLVERIGKAVDQWEIAPLYLSMFGSMARGDGTDASDIDLFVIRPDTCGEYQPVWRAQLNKLANDVRRWTGNHPAFIEVSSADVLAMEAADSPILSHVQRDGIPIRIDSHHSNHHDAEQLLSEITASASGISL